MKHKYLFVTVLLAVLLLAGMGLTGLYVAVESEPEEELQIVTSFYPVYIAVSNVVGDTEGVSVTNLSEPKTGCMHDYQLTPEDMKILSRADIFVVNGGGIESFLADVAEQYPELVIIDACQNMELLGEAEDDGNPGGDEHDYAGEDAEHDHAGANAHVWMSIERYMAQITNIADALAQRDAGREAVYRENAENYRKRLVELRDGAAGLSDDAQNAPVVLLHEAYAYVAEDYGMQVIDTLNLDEERQVSAGEVAELIAQIRENGVAVVLAEELYGKDMGEIIQEETDAKVYYLDTLNRGTYQRDSYLTGMEENIRILKEAFAE